MENLAPVSVDAVLSQAAEPNGSMADSLVRGLEASGLIDFVSGDQLSGAEAQAAFAELGSDALYEYCFAAGTLVLMADGSAKRIEDIQPGEGVLSVPDRAMAAGSTAHDSALAHAGASAAASLPLRKGWGEDLSVSTVNETTATTQFSSLGITPSPPTPESRRVVQAYHNAPARLLDLYIGDDVIRTTLGHPFFVQDSGWIRAENLQPGDQFYSHTGEWLTLSDARQTEDVQPVYNLQVEVEWLGKGEVAWQTIQGKAFTGLQDIAYAVGTGHFYPEGTVTITQGRSVTGMGSTGLTTITDRTIRFQGSITMRDKFGFPDNIVRNLYKNYWAGVILQNRLPKTRQYHAVNWTAKWPESIEIRVVTVNANFTARVLSLDE